MQQKITAHAQALAAESTAQLPGDPQIGLGLAIRAVQTSATPDALLALRQALDASPLRFVLPPVAGPDLAGCQTR